MTDEPRGNLGDALAEVRAAVAAALARTGEHDPGDLVLAVSEVVANAHRHGEPPVDVEVAVVDGRVRVRVADRGRGPGASARTDLPPADAEGGRGRWLAARLAAVTEETTPDGVTVHLAVGGRG